MSYNDTVQRVWRETVASYGPEGISRPEAIEAASATLMVEVRAGRLDIDMERAVRAELVRVDEADGRAADNIIERAAYGEVPLTDESLDLIVTLGGGRRKAWRDVNPDDLDVMSELRFENYRKVRSSFEKFNLAVRRIRSTVVEHGTVGAAFDADGFPPVDLTTQAGAA